MKYVLKISEKANIDRYEEGAIITIQDSDFLLCFGKNECEILEIALSDEFSTVINVLLNTYRGDDIAQEFEAFCNILIEHGVLEKEEI